MIESGAVLQGRYQVGDLLAHGGMADVFRARDTTLGRDVAIKVFRVGAGDVRRFHGETQILAAMSHPNLVRVFDAGDHHGQPYVVLELVAGPTLAHRLRDGPLSDGEARLLGADLAGALAYVHAAKIVHRDVKPSNILLAPDGRALLGDFGIALLVDASRLTGTAETLGTAAYLAPEQVGGGAITSAVDVYALGLVLLEVLTGRRAFVGTAQEVVMARLARPPSVPADLANPWPELLAAMTAMEPSARPSAVTIEAYLRGSDDAPTVFAIPTPMLGSAAGGAASLEPPGDATVAATRTHLFESVAVDTPAGGEGHRRARDSLRWMVGLGAVLLVLLALGLLASRAEDPAADPGPDPTTTSVPTTSVPTTSVPTTAVATTIAPSPPAVANDPVVSRCLQLDAAKQAIDAEKQRIEQQYREDKDTRQRLKRELDDQKQRIESEMRAARC